MSNSIINQVLAQINHKSETDRQHSQELRLSMYLDDYESEVEKLLKKQFHRDNHKRLYPMMASYYNLYKKIVDLKSVIYKKEARRKWYKRDGKTEDQKYSELIKETNINTNQQLCNKLTTINNASMVRIISDVENKKIKYEAVPGELLSVTQNSNNPKEIISVLHMVVIQDSYSKLANLPNDPGADHTEINKYIQKYFYWDNDYYIILDADRKLVVQPDNPENKNPYGFIPYVLFQSMPSISGSIWNETVGHDLYRGTLQVNVLQTYLNNALKLTGYRQPWITGVDSDEIKKLDERVSDGLQPMALSSPEAKFGSFELSASVEILKDCIHDIISEIADNHGVSFNSRTTSAQKQSGLALSIQKDQLDNLRVEQFPLYRESENELAQKTVKIANQDLGINIDVEGTFSINFYEEQQETTPNEKIEQDTFYLKNNLKSVVDLYKEIDPDCTDKDEAMKRIAENKEINDNFRNTFGLMVDEGKDENESDENTEDENGEEGTE